MPSDQHLEATVTPSLQESKDVESTPGSSDQEAKDIKPAPPVDVDNQDTAGDEAIEYPNAVALSLITVALALAIFLTALVSLRPVLALINQTDHNNCLTIYRTISSSQPRSPSSPPNLIA
jgi:hypothetical protein